MARKGPRSEVVIAVGLVVFIAVAFLKPWGSPAPTVDVRPTASAVLLAPTSTATAGPTPSPIGAEQIRATITWVPIGAAPVGLVEADGDLWFAADGGHLVRIETETLTVTDIALDPTQFSGKIGLAGNGLNLWVTGADDHSIGLIDTSSLAVRHIPAVTTDSMVIDRIWGAVADGARLWSFADVHPSAEILASPCCSDLASTMLYSANVESDTMTQVREVKGPLAIRLGFGTVWVLAQPDGTDGPTTLDRLFIGSRSPSDAVVTTMVLPVGRSGSGPCDACIDSFLVGSNSLWIPTGRGNSVLRLDPEAGRVVATVELGRDVESVVESPDGYIWVAGGGSVGGGCDPAAGYVAVIDPSTNRIIRDTHVACPISLVAHDKTVWIGIDGPFGPLLEQIEPIP